MTNLDGYVLTELSGQTYLLPYGQNIATFRHGLKLNETGKLICRALQEGKTKEELPALLAAHFEADIQEIPLLQADIDHFFEQLHALGVLESPSPCLCFPTDSFRRFQIGTLILQINLKDELIPEEFLPFAVDAAGTFPADLTVSVHFGQPAPRLTGKVLIHNEELLIIESAECYSFLFPASPDLIECQIDKEARFACFYCRDHDSATFRQELFHGIRFAWLLTAEQKGSYAIHSASILYKEKAWLFSAPSGTGKSTHAKLWQDLYDTPPLNGDLNLLGIKDNVPVVYGLPWCGTSGIFTTETYPLGGVIFLQQSDRDHIVTLTPDECSLMLSQRLISPTWTKEMLQSSLTFCEQLEPLIGCFLLHCTAEPSAANVCRAAIDTASAGTHIR